MPDISQWIFITPSSRSRPLSTHYLHRTRPIYWGPGSHLGRRAPALTFIAPRGFVGPFQTAGLQNNVSELSSPLGHTRPITAALPDRHRDFRIMCPSWVAQLGHTRQLTAVLLLIRTSRPSPGLQNNSWVAQLGHTRQLTAVLLLIRTSRPSPGLQNYVSELSSPARTHTPATAVLLLIRTSRHRDFRIMCQPSRTHTPAYRCFIFLPLCIRVECKWCNSCLACHFQHQYLLLAYNQCSNYAEIFGGSLFWGGGGAMRPDRRPTGGRAMRE